MLHGHLNHFTKDEKAECVVKICFIKNCKTKDNFIKKCKRKCGLGIWKTAALLDLCQIKKQQLRSVDNYS